MSAFNISSLLQTEQSDKTEAEARKLFQDTLEQGMGSFPSHNKDDGALAYYATVLKHVAKLFTHFTDQLLDEDRLHSTGFNIVDQARRESSFHDMGILEYATSQRKMLKNMNNAIRGTETTLEDIESHASHVMVKRRQEPTQHPVPSDSSSRSSLSTSASIGVFSAVASQASVSDSSRIYHPSDRDRRSTSPASPQDDDDEIDDETHQAALDAMELDDIDMESLKHRGKGEYVCPYWRTCQKGGLDYDGTPKVFQRNCMFRQHIQKHSKPHKCRLPGCPNKEGFARKDQLLRHQQNVKHDPLPLPMPRR